MIRRQEKLLILLTASLLLLFTISSPAQQNSQDQKKYKSASLDGTTGLFKTWDAETLRPGEFNITGGVSHTNRDPGELVLRSVPVGGAVGLHERVELFGSFDVQKHVEASSTQTYRVHQGQLPIPATSLLGATSFTNESPFIDVPESDAHGDSHLGLKLGLFSERRGDPLAMSIVAYSTFPGHRSVAGLNRGQSSGAFQGGFGYLLSKRAGRVAQLHLNTMVNFVGNPSKGPVELADLQDEFIYRAGAAWPTYGVFQLITEIDGKTYFGSGTTGINPSSPVDLIIGGRAYLREWLSVGAGYRATLNHIEEDAASKIYPAGTNGFVVQVAMGRRRNDPPTVTCTAASPTIKQDEKTTIRCRASDADGDRLSYSWSASGGRVDGSGDTATFDATGVAPGQYSVTATVSDGRHQVPGVTEITVLKNNKPPTVSAEPSAATVTQGESVTITAKASDPNNDRLTYAWTVNGEPVAADGPSFTFGSEGRQPGKYTVTVTVSDGELSATSSSTITVVARPQPNRPPVVQCQAPSVDVASGATVSLTASVSDPDNDSVNLSWSATGGTIRGSGQSVTFDASGLSAGIYTVTATADDGRGGKASCAITVYVSELIRLVREGPVPCGNFAAGRARVDNCAKAILDDLSVRMTNDPRLRANIIGYTDGSNREQSAKNLGQQRAQAVADYLESKGIQRSRLTVTDGGSQNPIGDSKTADGRRQNRRVEIELTAR